MKGWQASDRWGCSHAAPDGCPWCANTDAEVYRDATVADYVPIYGIPAQQAAPAASALTLAEWISTVNPGFFERSAGVS